MKKVLKIKIFGTVQGVSFRYYAARKARELGIAGWVRNESGGSISILAEGEQQAVDEFVSWCRHGPPAAAVTGFESKEVAIFGLKDFSVKR